MLIFPLKNMAPHGKCDVLISDKVACFYVQYMYVCDYNIRYLRSPFLKEPHNLDSEPNPIRLLIRSDA